MIAQRLSDLVPKRDDELADEHGTIRCMGVIDGYWIKDNINTHFIYEIRRSRVVRLRVLYK